jgi:hypothetical protein
MPRRARECEAVHIPTGLCGVGFLGTHRNLKERLPRWSAPRSVFARPIAQDGSLPRRRSGTLLSASGRRPAPIERRSPMRPPVKIGLAPLPRRGRIPELPTCGPRDYAAPRSQSGRNHAETVHSPTCRVGSPPSARQPKGGRLGSDHRRATGGRHNEPERHHRSAQRARHPDRAGVRSLVSRATATAVGEDAGIERPAAFVRRPVMRPPARTGLDASVRLCTALATVRVQRYSVGAALRMGVAASFRAPRGCCPVACRDRASRLFLSPECRWCGCDNRRGRVLRSLAGGGAGERRFATTGQDDQKKSADAKRKAFDRLLDAAVSEGGYCQGTWHDCEWVWKPLLKLEPGQNGQDGQN